MTEIFKNIEQTCVVVGSLNPGIIHPGWLAKNDVVAESAKQEWELGFELGAPTPSFKDDHLSWHCLHDKLVVSSIDGTDPGNSVARIFQLLSHTPVTGVGNNFKYLILDSGIKEGLAELMKSKGEDTLSKLDLPASSYQTTLKIGVEDALLSLTFNHSDEGVHAVSFNFHRATPNAKIASSAAKKWQTDKAKALSIIAKLIEEVNG